MKRLLLYILVSLISPVVFAQKSAAEQQAQLQKEMEELKRTMSEQMKSLHDSMARLQEMLNEETYKPHKNSDWVFKYRIPEEEIVEPYLHHLDEYIRQYELEAPKWEYHLRIPGIPELPEVPELHDELEFELKAPHGQKGYFYLHPPDWDWELEVPHHEWKEHHNDCDDLLEMLPFYDMFK